MALTRKDFEYLADILKDAEPQTDKMVKRLAIQIANWCETQNDLFDRKKFLKAAGVKT